MLIPHSRGGRASPGWGRTTSLHIGKKRPVLVAGRAGTRRNADRHVTSTQRGPQADVEVSDPPAFTELIQLRA